MLLNKTKKEMKIVSLKTEVNHFFLRLRLFGVESSETSRLVSHMNSLHVVDIIYTTRREQHTRFSTPIWQESPGALSHPLLKAETDILFKGFHFTTQEDNISKKKSKILYRYIKFNNRGVFSRAVIGILSELCWKRLMCIFWNVMS